MSCGPGWASRDARSTPGGRSDRLPVAPGYLVEVVYDGSPADRAGIRGGNLSVVVQGDEYLLGGDILTAIQGTPIRTHSEYLTKVRTLRPGQRVKVVLAPRRSAARVHAHRGRAPAPALRPRGLIVVGGSERRSPDTPHRPPRRALFAPSIPPSIMPSMTGERAPLLAGEGG